MSLHFCVSVLKWKYDKAGGEYGQRHENNHRFGK